jgi:hypothetical protein
MQSPDDQVEKLARNERRGIWTALVVVLALAATAILQDDTRRALLTALAIGVVFAVTWLGQQRVRGAKKALRATREVVLRDEWRQAAIALAYKWAFFAMLGTLVAFCLLSVFVPIDLSGQMVATLTVALGTCAFLTVFLLRDGD